MADRTHSGSRRCAVLLVSLGGAAWLVAGSGRAQERPPQPSAPRTAPAAPTPPVAPRTAPSAAPQQTAVVAPVGPPAGSLPVPAPVAPSAPRFQFDIAANTPLEKLLPQTPRLPKTTGPAPAEELARVPEVEFQAAWAKGLPSAEALKQTAHQIAKVNFLNARKADAFMEALRARRPDLDGLPFAMGDACRIQGERSRQFALAVAIIHSQFPEELRQTGVGTGLGLGGVPAEAPAAVPPITSPAPPPPPPAAGVQPQPARPVPADAAAPTPERLTRSVREQDGPEGFWERYQAACAQHDRQRSPSDHGLADAITRARIAALMQILAPEAPSVRLGLVKHLATISHVEATRALARLAVFSAEGDVRHAATDALKVRRERDYTDILLQAFRYPWPAVAHRAGEAVVRLERADLVPQLVDLLDASDPRAPVVRRTDKQSVPVVRELVRVNHHRNCLLCHAPGNTAGVSPETLTAGVPIPGEPLPEPSNAYRPSSPDVLVRVDVTYLRQDFSVLLPVADAHPWPEMQRFDFLVRTRALAEEEAATYRARFGRHDPSRPSPYHRAVLAALRELTGRDAEPTAEAWRRLLDLPSPTGRRVARR